MLVPLSEGQSRQGQKARPTLEAALVGCSALLPKLVQLCVGSSRFTVGIVHTRGLGDKVNQTDVSLKSRFRR